MLISSCLYSRREKLVRKALGLMTQRRWNAALGVLQTVLRRSAGDTESELYFRVNLAIGKCHLFAGRRGDRGDGHYEHALHFLGIASGSAGEVRGEALAFAARCYREMESPVLAARKTEEARAAVAALRQEDPFNDTADEIEHLLEA